MKSIESETASARSAVAPKKITEPTSGRQIALHRIRKTFVLSPLLDALSRPQTAVQAVKMAFTALRYFFYPQFESRLFPKKRPAVNVDHPLDQDIPFRPDLVAEYLTFFFLWINTGAFLVRNYGRQGRKAYSRYIDEVISLYRECGSVYLRKQSTTRRPPEAVNSLFSIIHSLDPHLHCVPSLHIIIAVGNWILGRRYLRELSRGVPGLREKRAMEYIRQEAVRISESVLFVKQHSVNCVGATLFYLRARFPEFDESEIHLFMGEYFSYEGSDLPKKEEIKDYVYSLYARLWREYEKAGDENWRKVIFSFLKEFKNNPPFDE
jgi:hypothetical protein